MEKNNKYVSSPGYGYPPKASSENYPPPYAPQIDPVQNYPPRNGIHNPPFTHVNYPTAVGQPNIVVVQTQPVSLNFMGAIVMSCVVYWLCGAIFGGIAFILAMVGQSQASNGDDNSGRCMLRASYILSSIGIVAGIAAIIALSVFYSRYYYYNYNSRNNNGVYVIY